MAKKEKTCGNCDYYFPAGDVVGQCRRYPPIQDGAGLNTIDKPPTISKAGWCGEYKPR